MTNGLYENIRSMLESLTDPTLTQRIAFVVNEIVDTYHHNDIDRRIALCDPDIVFVDPIGQPPIHGREALRSFFLGYVAEGWAFSMVVDELIILSNEALMTWTVHLSKESAGGARITASNMLAFSAEGLIRSWRVIFDSSRVSKWDVVVAGESNEQ